MKDYTNSQISALIDEHIHKKRDRLILKLHFVDGCTYEQIAEHPEIDLSARWIAAIISKHAAQLSKYI